MDYREQDVASNLVKVPRLKAGRSTGNIVTILTCIVVISVLAGCSRTYIGTGAQGVGSPDGISRLCVTSYGAYGRAYVEKSRKKIVVWIGEGYGTNKVRLFSDSFTVVGSAVHWDVNWRSPDEVVVEVYDYGDGLLRSEGRRSSTLATFNFRREKSGREFVYQKHASRQIKRR